jgi:hypothetical protein
MTSIGSISSHIENISAVGKLPICGNVYADKLARLTLEQKKHLLAKQYDCCHAD